MRERRQAGVVEGGGAEVIVTAHVAEGATEIARHQAAARGETVVGGALFPPLGGTRAIAQGLLAS
jgi:hypothetical protein